MKLDVPSLLGSALAFLGRPDAPPAGPPQAWHVAQQQPGNTTDAIRAGLAPFVIVDEPGCAAVIAMIGADPAKAQCLDYAQQLAGQADPTSPAAGVWLSGYCAASCPFHFSVAAGQVVAGCTFKPDRGMDPTELAVWFRTTADVMAAVTCVKDPGGNYCILTVQEALRNSPIPVQDRNNPAAATDLVTRLCSIPCGLQLLDAARGYTGYNSSVICSSTPPALPSSSASADFPTAPPPASGGVPPPTGPIPDSAPPTAATPPPPATESPAAPPDNSTPGVPGPDSAAPTAATLSPPPPPVTTSPPAVPPVSTSPPAVPPVSTSPPAVPPVTTSPPAVPPVTTSPPAVPPVSTSPAAVPPPPPPVTPSPPAVPPPPPPVVTTLLAPATPDAASLSSAAPSSTPPPPFPGPAGKKRRYLSF